MCRCSWNDHHWEIREWIQWKTKALRKTRGQKRGLSVGEVEAGIGSRM